MIQLHNYQPANSSSAKYVNWKTLNEKAFRKIGFQIHRSDIEKVIGAVSGSIEKVLYYVYKKIQNYHPPSKEDPNKEKNIKIVTETMDYARELSIQMAEKEEVIKELKETVEILETKIKKMEQLNKLKDAKIDSLMRKLDENIGI